jgi:hypothetical protein
MWRNQIEEGNFKLGFFEELGEEMEKKFTDPDYYEKTENKFDMKKLKIEM